MKMDDDPSIRTIDNHILKLRQELERVLLSFRLGSSLVAHQECPVVGLVLS